MKRNTWVIVAIALALTGSVVIAKSIFTTMGHAEATPNDTAVTLEWSSPAPHVAVQTEGTTVMVEAESREADQEDEQAPWTVLVVRGEELEKIAYPSAETKANVPDLKE